MTENYDWRERAADFDRRIDRLTDRHEALAQSVEILAHSLAETRDIQNKNEVLQRKNEEMLAQVGEFIHSLARIAESHKKRISDLEQ